MLHPLSLSLILLNCCVSLSPAFPLSLLSSLFLFLSLFHSFHVFVFCFCSMPVSYSFSLTLCFFVCFSISLFLSLSLSLFLALYLSQSLLVVLFFFSLSLSISLYRSLFFALFSCCLSLSSQPYHVKIGQRTPKRGGERGGGPHQKSPPRSKGPLLFVKFCLPPPLVPGTASLTVRLGIS